MKSATTAKDIAMIYWNPAKGTTRAYETDAAVATGTAIADELSARRADR